MSLNPITRKTAMLFWHRWKSTITILLMWFGLLGPILNWNSGWLIMILWRVMLKRAETRWSRWSSKMVHINSSHLAKLTNTLSYFLCFRDNYVSVKDTFWSAWSDISIHQWLVDHGYIRSDAQVKRDELIKLANEKYACLSFQIAQSHISFLLKIQRPKRQVGCLFEMAWCTSPGLPSRARR